jgi:hypothetical protein
MAANVLIIAGHHVLALQSPPEGWQATSLLERCREHACRRRAHGAAARAVSGRDQRFAGIGLAAVDRGEDGAAVRPFLSRPRQTRPSRPRCLTMARRSLAHNFQAVWYGAAIMALCWPAMPSEVKFAADSLLEGTGFEPSVPPSRRAFSRPRRNLVVRRPWILSYSPPLERAILRRLTRAPTLMLHSMPVPGPLVGECSLASSRSQ